MTATNNVKPVPPGSFGLPVIGESLAFVTDGKFAQKRHQKYGSVFKTQIFGQPTVVLKGAEANRFVLTQENQSFEVTWPTSTRRLLGNASLALQHGAEHQSRRKILYQAFQPRALASYAETMLAITQRYVRAWAQTGELTWYPELRKYTFDVACKLLVGVDNASQTRLCDDFETWCAGLFMLPIELPWTRFGKAMKARSRMMVELERLIQRRQQMPASQTDALGLLLSAEDENGDRLGLEELKEQVLLLLFAGHETLTSAIASFCLLMAQYPEVFAKVRAEQERLGPDLPLTFETLKQMTYLEQVLKEVLRLIPPVGGGFRRVLKACEFQGYQIPEGWTVLYQIGSTHSDDQLYPDPDRFDPERFGSEAGSPAFGGYVPFGAGLRECLGKEFARLEMKLFAALLAREYAWELLPNQDLSLAAVPTPHPQDGLKVRFGRR